MSGYRQTLFPFMSDVCLMSYIRAETKDMRDMYNYVYKITGMNYTDFVINIYVPNYAPLWEKANRKRYFDENILSLEEYLGGGNGKEENLQQVDRRD